MFQPSVEALFHEDSCTLTYVVWDPATRDAVVVDPVLDFDPVAVRIDDASAQAVLAFVESRRLKVHFVLETHAHADHLTGAQILCDALGCGVAVGERIIEVQGVFRSLLRRGDVPVDGSSFDVLAADGQVLEAGSLRIEALSTPGHTPACVTWRVGDALFSGDTLFMPDFGTGRCDFPGGSAEHLYASVHRLYALPDELRVFVGHDYQPAGRELEWETTIGQSRRENRHLRTETSLGDFVAFRTARDERLRPPRLIHQSLQVNIAAGRLPPVDDNGQRYFVMPIDVF